MATDDVVWRGEQQVPVVGGDRLGSVLCVVTVRELLVPAYALEFDLAVRGTPPDVPVSVERRLTTAEIASTVKLHQQRDQAFTSTTAAGTQADRAVRRWVLKHKTPPRNDLVVWLLERMVLFQGPAPVLRLLGEAGVTKSQLRSRAVAAKTLASPRGPSADEPLPPFSPHKAAEPETTDSPDEALPPFSPAENDADTHEPEAAAEPTAQYAFEPTQERRRKSAAGTAAPSRWTADAWRLALELRKSKADVEKAKELRRRQELVANARRQTLMASASRLRTSAHTDKRDKRLVKAATHKAIEHHEVNMAEHIEKQTRREYIQYLREHERTTRLLEVGQRRTWHKGPHLGPGPLPTDVYAAGGDARDDDFVYDVHGRRHAVTSADEVRAKSVFDAAMKKLQRVAAKAGPHMLALFRQHDRDRSGTLDEAEFTVVLQTLKVTLTRDQSRALFSFFDANHTGAIDYGEVLAAYFLWSFFNRRAFLKKWATATTKYSPQRLHALFYEADTTGRGALSARAFFIAMSRLGFHLSTLDEALLLHKFDANGDGFIDFAEFQRAFATEEAAASSGAMVAAPNAIETTDLDAELAALGVIQDKLERLLKQVH
ncbi:hypothetical protein ACHHYP_05101 [Achlya hypogyna]|uniref:EF-hand domain-containing protein n=1 Tax=Achlya hypogyna TaxID=1202772 RepID=A0A1V9YZ18_ACHHY|nr:hypothetical protein ACHHYP_05101 [Achlya hypogyna]